MFWELGEEWLIVYCENDTSFSLIQDSDAVFDKKTLELGDTVKFYFNKSEYVGDVRDMGGKIFNTFTRGLWKLLKLVSFVSY